MMRRYDVVACVLAILLLLAWAAVSHVAQVFYSVSFAESPLLRCGDCAYFLLPFAAMYLVKAVKGEGLGSAIAAGMLSFAVFFALMSLDIWFPDFHPYCDESSGHLLLNAILGISLAVSAGVSDALVLRCLRKLPCSSARQWFVRRAIRVIGTMLLAGILTLLLCFLISRVVRIDIT